MTGRKYYVTTAIPYVNAKPHVGHALLLILADVLARYHRQRGDDTWSLTGTDDNSLSNVLAAEAEGIPIQELVNRNAGLFQALREPLALSFDDFIRTSGNPKHTAGAQKLWRACRRNDDVYRRYYEGQYCVRCERFYSDDELDDGRCPIHHRPTELVREDNYFFRLSRYTAQLADLIATDRLRVLPETRKHEVLRFVQSGLEDFSISRSPARARGWGIPVPDDPGQVMYVWFDALCNYITALDYAANGERYRRYWRDSPARVHIIGKDLLRFHAVYWPAMLLSAGEPPPTLVCAHEFFTVNGEKISKSLGNAVDPIALVAQLGADGLRYCLLRELPRTEDTDLTAARLAARYHSDLANDLGNLVNRAVSMLARYRGGVVPSPGSPSANEEVLQSLAAGLPARIAAMLDAFDFRAALSSIWELVTQSNRYVEQTAPWLLARREREGDNVAQDRLDTALYTIAESVRLIAYFIEPFLPSTTSKIASQLGLSAIGTAGWGGLPAATRVGAAQPIFPRLEAAVPGD